MKASELTPTEQLGLAKDYTLLYKEETPSTPATETEEAVESDGVITVLIKHNDVGVFRITSDKASVVNGLLKAFVSLYY